MASTFAAAWEGRLLSILRIMAGYMFLQHGAQKLFGFPGGGQHAPFHLFTMAGIGGVLEFFGGILILLGLFTRPVAFLLSGEMAVAYFTVHAKKSFFFTVVNGGDSAVLYCFIFLLFVAAGAGPWSLDAMTGSRRR